MRPSDGVVIGRNMGGWTGEGHVPAQPYAGGTAQIVSAEHGLHRVICGGYSFVSVRRGVRVGQASETAVHPVHTSPSNFQSASSRADTGALSSVTIPLARLRLQFVLAIKVARHLFLSPRCAIQACKQSFRSISKAFQVIPLSAQALGLAAGVYGQHIGRRKSENVRKDGEKIHV